MVTISNCVIHGDFSGPTIEITDSESDAFISNAVIYPVKIDFENMVGAVYFRDGKFWISITHASLKRIDLEINSFDDIKKARTIRNLKEQL